MVAQDIGYGLMALTWMRPSLRLNPAPHRASLSAVQIPDSFDARAAFPACALSIGAIRNQGHCGSCWAFGAVESLADRICIASNGSETLRLSAQSLIDCDKSDGGCGGGFLDTAWEGLVSRGALSESCDPYEHCDDPQLPNCTKPNHALQNPSAAPSVCPRQCAGGGPLAWHKAASAYAVAEPGDVEGMQRELLAHGPFEVAFFVFSDFYKYSGGVYRKAADAQGPMGGHAVKLVGWGEDAGVPYWLVANSWSSEWGESGFFRIVRGTNECGIETTPAAGLPAVVPTRGSASLEEPPRSSPSSSSWSSWSSLPSPTPSVEEADAARVMSVEEAEARLVAAIAAGSIAADHSVYAALSQVRDSESRVSAAQRMQKRPTLQAQFSATMRVAQGDHGPDGKPGDGCILARQLKGKRGVASSPLWFDAHAKRIAQINAQLAYHPPPQQDKIAGRYDLPPKYPDLNIQSFFNETVCYAMPLHGLCANGTSTCPPQFGFFGDFGTPFSGILGMFYLNTTFLETSAQGDDVWQWTWNEPTLMPNGTKVIITRNFTYNVAAPSAHALADAPRALRRLEWTQGLPNGGSHEARLCTVIDFEKDYMEGPPPIDAFEPKGGVGSCVWP